MKKKSGVSFGPGASSLILIFVVLAMSVLGMLALMNSRNDIRLSERSVQVAQEAYAFSGRMEERWAALDQVFAEAARTASDDEAYLSAVEAALPDTVNLYDREVSWTELDSWEGTNGLRQLSCAVEVLPLGSEARSQWVRHELTAVTEDAVVYLNDRAESKRLALDEIIRQAAGSAKDQAAFLAAVESALPADMALQDGAVRFTELSAGMETDWARQLACALALPVFGEDAPAASWSARTMTDVTDDAILALMDQADSALIELNGVFINALQAALDAGNNNVEAVTAAYVQAIGQNLPEGQTISWVEESGDLRLNCAVELQPLGYTPLAKWTCRALMAE